MGYAAFDTLQEHARVLGVSPDATPEQVKAAWRAKARQFHPDVQGGGSTEQMAAINAAYDALRKRSGSFPRTGSAGAGATRMKPRRFYIKPDVIETWQERLHEAMHNSGYPPRAPFHKILLAKIFRRPSPSPDHNILIPDRFEYDGRMLTVLYKECLVVGENFLCVPRFTLTGTNRIQLHSIPELTIYVKSSPAQPVEYLEMTKRSNLTGFPGTRSALRFGPDAH